LKTRENQLSILAKKRKYRKIAGEKEEGEPTVSANQGQPRRHKEEFAAYTNANGKSCQKKKAQIERGNTHGGSERKKNKSGSGGRQKRNTTIDERREKKKKKNEKKGLGEPKKAGKRPFRPKRRKQIQRRRLKKEKQ